MMIRTERRSFHHCHHCIDCLWASFTVLSLTVCSVRYHPPCSTITWKLIIWSCCCYFWQLSAVGRLFLPQRWTSRRCVGIWSYCDCSPGNAEVGTHRVYAIHFHSQVFRRSDRKAGVRRPFGGLDDLRGALFDSSTQPRPCTGWKRWQSRALSLPKPRKRQPKHKDRLGSRSFGT